MTSTSPYLEPNQSRPHPPTDFENKLGDAIEAAYASGVHDLDGLVAHLNESGLRAPDGEPWTTGTFTTLLAELGR